ncbi:carbonic anhydrase/acetyltransferase-like protein (isoleucine patch superfamily) [Desulfobaculum xiamenense]|uniref:Carbonic anhydrase/acetyltransferase-like protein (Isoleucine patch superfamily) n=1 Tax=Desulfobaculum xiamenense TaxID=995050 RepID=A0A846QJ68_9BACT|nr:transferase [Desulfobaculum xiamenense]NJB67107.1 carbonic anhydrase/acetyltransferase-like protein (isoleucine patch superfamily) [Desulfobaculum xiamenense]
MNQLQKLLESIVTRVNVNLREFTDVGPHIRNLVDRKRLSGFYAFYGLTQHHPLYFKFVESCLSGTYFLGKCDTSRSIIYKSDIRGDELKRRGDVVTVGGLKVRLLSDEFISIRDSYLVKTLVHNHSHDLENLEKFAIRNTVALHWSNIHGSPMEGCFLGPFATVDLTSAHNCVFGSYSYTQVGDISNTYVKPGRVWIKSEGEFEFNYQFDEDVLHQYVAYETGKPPKGILMDYVEDRKADFLPIYSFVQEHPVPVPPGASLSPYAVVKGQTRVDRNVLVAQRAYLEEAWLGEGSNAQENCYIVHSSLEAEDVTAHGGKIIHAHLGRHIFVGFNAFLHGTPENPLQVGENSIIMPHTIIDADEPLEIPAETLVWGYIRTAADLEQNSISLKELEDITDGLEMGAMRFSGNGKIFANVFRDRIRHILEENGAFYTPTGNNAGHAQKNQEMAFNIMQPYPSGDLEGLYPALEINPTSVDYFAPIED